MRTRWSGSIRHTYNWHAQNPVFKTVVKELGSSGTGRLSVTNYRSCRSEVILRFAEKNKREVRPL